MYYKYLKYKNKYLNSKSVTLMGGTRLIINDDDYINQFMNKIENEPNFNSLLNKTKENYTIEYIYIRNCNLIKIIKNSECTNSLFVLAGISTKSFMGTSTVILQNIDLLISQFDIIYLIDYSYYSEMQKNACQKRDVMIENKCECITANIYNPELEMNKEIARNINCIIDDIIFHNCDIHLLGKCNGAWVIMNMLYNNKNIKKYKSVYLGVPGIPIRENSIVGLNLISDELTHVFKHINFKIGFRSDDGYDFIWRKERMKSGNTILEIISQEVELYKTKFGEENVFFETDLSPVKDKGNHEITDIFLHNILK
jgi:hypothetical protein